MVLVEILSRVLVIIYILSFLNILRHSYKLLASWFSTKGTGEETIRYILDSKHLILLGLSIAYVISGIFTGITL